jgi:hypothetical protein
MRSVYTFLKLYASRKHWEDVVKTRNLKGFGKQTEVIVVVAATYYLSTTLDSLVCLQTEKRIGVDDLLFSRSQASALFKLRSAYGHCQDYKAKLCYLTNGAAGAFAIVLNLISDMMCHCERTTRTEIMGTRVKM